MSQSSYLLGIDIGTTGTKSILTDTEGNVLARAYKEYPTYHPAPGFSEQNPEDWWSAVIETVQGVLKSESNAASLVSAISLSTQGGTLVPADENGIPLGAAVLWSDTRSSSVVDLFEKVCSGEQLKEKTGWRLRGGLNALNLLWLRENKPFIYKNAKKFMSVADFITFRLTGRYAIDFSNGGINQLLNINECVWDKDILDATGIKEDSLPELMESGEVIGCLTNDAARELGLSSKVLVAAGAHDQYCVALGAGLVSPGEMLLATGTAWAVTGIFNEGDITKESPLSRSRSAIKGLWGGLISIRTGGVCLEWLRDGLDIRDKYGTQKISFAELDEIVMKRAPGARGLLFYPYFSGCTYPKSIPEAKAVLTGLDLSHDRFDIARAIMEGVAFQIAWCVEEFSIEEKKPIRMTGGATKSKLWTEMVAAVLDRPVILQEVSDAACIGAAMLAGIGLKHFSCCAEAYQKFKSPERLVTATKQDVECYRELFFKYKKNYCKLNGILER